MTSLAQIFADLQQEWRDRRRRGTESYQRHLKTVAETAPMLRAVIAHNRGDESAIPTLLRSGYRLTPDDQTTLAQFLEGGFEEPTKTGRPKSNERWVAMVAGKFVAEWRETAKMCGVSIYGEAENMRDEAIEFVIAEFIPPPWPINREAVIEYMTKRGKARRN